MTEVHNDWTSAIMLDAVFILAPKDTCAALLETPPSAPTIVPCAHDRGNNSGWYHAVQAVRNAECLPSAPSVQQGNLPSI
jgi:hypothetical protein